MHLYLTVEEHMCVPSRYQSDQTDQAPACKHRARVRCLKCMTCRGKSSGAAPEAVEESAEERAANREAASAEAVAAAAKIRQAQQALLRAASRQETRDARDRDKASKDAKNLSFQQRVGLVVKQLMPQAAALLSGLCGCAVL